MVRTSAAPKKRIAVCVAGAVRSLVERRVYDSLWQFFKPADVYFHLFSATELSARGQRNLSVAQLPQLQRALANAKAVRFQTSENPTTCNQMTTGKFYKMQMCAGLIYAAMEADEHLKYDVLVMTRPDLAYDKYPGRTVLDYLPNKPGNWFFQVGDEMFIASFQRGLILSLTMTQARCCDTKRRLPSSCFLRRIGPPRANFIQRRHFQSMTQLPNPQKGKHPYRIVRTEDQLLEMKGRDLFTLHGKTKPDVATVEDPEMSPMLTSWFNITDGEQRSWLRTYLPALSSVVCQRASSSPNCSALANCSAAHCVPSYNTTKTNSSTTRQQSPHRASPRRGEEAPLDISRALPPRGREGHRRQH